MLFLYRCFIFIKKIRFFFVYFDYSKKEKKQLRFLPFLCIYRYIFYLNPDWYPIYMINIQVDKDEMQ